MKHLLLPASAVLLSSCIVPCMINRASDPNTDPYRSQYQQNMRDQGREMSQMAYERGWQDGQADAERHQSQNYNRYRTSRFDHSTEMAYRDGYNQSYAKSSSLKNFNQPTVPAPAKNDAAYQQGYDYGLRDRVGGRAADPAAHVGGYDPRKRSNFERGYYDGYNSRSSMNQRAPAGGGGNLWNL